MAAVDPGLAESNLSPSELASRFAGSWVSFFLAGVGLVLRAREESIVLRRYEALEYDVDLAKDLATNDRAIRSIERSVKKLIVSNPRVRGPEARWLINEMEAFASACDNATSEDSDELGKAGDNIKGSVETFLNAAKNTISRLLGKLWPFSRSDVKAIEGVESSSKLLNELFKLIARTN
jgi:hypothetical protein